MRHEPKLVTTIVSQSQKGKHIDRNYAVNVFGGRIIDTYVSNVAPILRAAVSHYTMPAA